MIADDLRIGDTFVCHSQKEWDAMSPAEKRKAKPAKLIARLGSCVAYERIHLRTSAGTWCIPKVAPVVKLAIDSPARKNNRYAHAKRNKAVTA